MGVMAVRTMRALGVSAALALLMAAGPAAVPASATVEEGLKRWRAGQDAAAVALWQAPAARGDAAALFHMGQAYRLGRGVEADTGQAIDLYRRAAQRGHLEATTNLGITLWQEGRRSEALQHLRAAADRGDPRAAFVLGVAIFTGDGVPRNAALGYAHVLRASEGGLAPATDQAVRMARTMTYEERARGQAAASALASGRPAATVMAELDRPFTTAGTLAAAAAAPETAEAPDGEAGGAPARIVTAAPQPGAAVATGEDWRVQLGAYATEGAARQAWASLVSQSAGQLQGLTPLYHPRAGLVRLQIGPFAARQEANALCQRLSAAGRPCFVTR
jgi:cell division septation protein DedD